MGINSRTKIGSVFSRSRFVDNNIFLYMAIIFLDEGLAEQGKEF